MRETRLHELLAERIVECIEIADQLTVSDPCEITVEAKSHLRRAYSAVCDRAAAIRVLGGLPRRPAEKAAPSEVLQELQAARARQPRRAPLARLFGGCR